MSLSSSEEALYRAVESGSLDDLEAAIQDGAGVDARNVHGHTPVMWAATEGHVRLVRRLLDLGADPNARDRNGQTPMMIAAPYPTARAMKLLISRGADPNAVRPIDGATPLTMAVSSPDSSPAVVEALLAGGADPTRASPKIGTPRAFIEKSGSRSKAAQRVHRALIEAEKRWSRQDQQ